MSVRRAQDERIEGTPDGLSAITEISDVPDAPTIGAATNVGTSRAYNNGSATVAYTSATTGGTPTTLTATSTPGSFTGTGSSPITVTGLQSATAYTFTVTPSNSTATGPASSSSSSITATTVPQAPTIGTATQTGQTTATVGFTAGATGGSSITGYTATSSPGSVTGTGASSPISITGLTAGTAYTFTVTATNTNGTSTASSASNSITTAAATIPALGSWTTAGSTSPGASGDSYYGVSLVSGEPRTFAFAGGRSTQSYYNNGKGGTWTASTAQRPDAQGLGSSSKSMTNSGLFYTYGGDTGTQTLVYSTSTGGSWTSQSAVNYNAGWSDGCYFENSGNKYLIAACEYSTGYTAARATVNASTGALSWSSISNYPVYAAAPRFARLTSVAIGMGGFTSASLSALRTNVYSYEASTGNWTSQTSLPFSPSGGYINGVSLTGPADSRVYVGNATSLWSRGDSSGTWTSETATPNSWSVGWGTVSAAGRYTLQLTSTNATYYQEVM